MNTTRFPKAIISAALAALASGALFWAAPVAPVRTARALPIYAQETGVQCGRCHINPNGGGPRTAFGRAFAANGHRLPGERRHRYRDSTKPGYDGYGGMMGGTKTAPGQGPGGVVGGGHRGTEGGTAGPRAPPTPPPAATPTR